MDKQKPTNGTPEKLRIAAWHAAKPYQALFKSDNQRIFLHLFIGKSKRLAAFHGMNDPMGWVFHLLIASEPACVSRFI